MTLGVGNGQTVPLGPVGVLGYQDVAPGDVVLENTGTPGSSPDDPAAPALKFVQVEVEVPAGGLSYVRVSLSYNQYNGTSLSQVWFDRDDGFLGFRTLLPHQIVDAAGDPTGLAGTSGGTLTLVDTDVPAGTHTYALWLWAFSEGNAELLTDPSQYPTYLLVEGI